MEPVGIVYKKLNQKDLEGILAYFMSEDVGEWSKDIVTRMFRHIQYQDNKIKSLNQKIGQLKSNETSWHDYRSIRR